ncbi:hypothetical protein Nizo2029_1285 [Lactiplantibacillus plantarum]|nr:hypothetical protein Nizo2029_1285 [Lactiplantibacillus plantarum]
MVCFVIDHVSISNSQLLNAQTSPIRIHNNVESWVAAKGEGQWLTKVGLEGNK